jgi:hypothetical protein
MTRNYRKEYDNYHSRPEQKRRRAGRNKARAIMTKSRGKAALAGRDIDHKDRNPLNNGRKNLRISSKSMNRSRNK